MRVDFKFRHCEPSNELQAYAAEKVAHLEKFEWKPSRLEFTFTKEKSELRVDILVRGDHLEVHAHSSADTFFVGIDEALHKVARQLSKKKAKVQNHKVS
jgi:ribosomal subunit interface protein